MWNWIKWLEEDWEWDGIGMEGRKSVGWNWGGGEGLWEHVDKLRSIVARWPTLEGRVDEEAWLLDDAHKTGNVKGRRRNIKNLSAFLNRTIL